MSYFKDMVAADVKRIFLNPDEFAEKHNIDGKEILCVLDKNINSDPTLAKALGVYSNTVTLYVSEKDMEVPKATGSIRIDGSVHLVVSAGIEDGMIVIVAEERRS